MLFVISSCDGMTPGIYSAPPLGIIVCRPLIETGAMALLKIRSDCCLNSISPNPHR